MIHVEQLTKRFGRLTAVDNLSFKISPGEAVALWGANGAGKTTVLRCLLHLIPFSGSVQIDGRDMRRAGKVARQKIGFVPQNLTFHDDLRVDETLLFYGRLKKIDFNHTAPLEALLDRLQLQPHLQKAVGDLSGGLKQRLALALALLADPAILMLDEPTASLDVSAREAFLSLLLDLKQAGKTIVFTTHRLDEMSTLADRVLHLVDGRLQADSSPAELHLQMGWTTMLHLSMPAGSIDAALTVLGQHGLEGRQNGRGIYVSVPASKKGLPLELLYREGIPVTDFSLD
ncbi:MAG: ABC transporter ATP-binding protein [Ardenticatenaceae bacterium]|nr:ABC transporter ATP-binding protein [Ardenticatenaceae bacterium]